MIYITGAGIISAIGTNKIETLSALLNQKTGIEPVKYLQTCHTKCLVGEVKRSNAEMREVLNIPLSETYIRSSLIGINAVKEALQQAQLKDLNYLNISLISSNTVAAMDDVERYYMDFLNNNSKNRIIELIDCGACTEQIADFFGGFKMISTISTACSSSANAMIMGANLIETGRADIVVAGGVECLSRYHLNGFNSLMLLDKNLCKPFDRDRSGINLGEGAGYLVLESADSVQKRGIIPIGKVSGYCNACDAYHPTATSKNGTGPYIAMKGALISAGLLPDDIDYINAHGTGTQNNDLTEGLAVMKLFGDKIPPLSSVKAFMGHTTSAAGGCEAVISLLVLENNFLPINLNYINKIEEHSFTPITNSLSIRPINNILSNSFGFGGNDSSIILSKI